MHSPFPPTSQSFSTEGVGKNPDKLRWGQQAQEQVALTQKVIEAFIIRYWMLHRAICFGQGLFSLSPSRKPLLVTHWFVVSSATKQDQKLDAELESLKNLLFPSSPTLGLIFFISSLGKGL